MSAKNSLWLSLVALGLGFGLGLTYAWLVSPVRYVDANPRALRADFKDRFRSAIAAAYASTGDLERARARLALLGDVDSAQALTAQSQRMLAAGEPLDSLRQVAVLASILSGQQPAYSSLTAFLTSTGTPTRPKVTPTPATSTPTFETLTPDAPILVAATSTLRPTRTPTPTLGAPYQLVGQDTVCDLELAEGLLQIQVMNATRRQIPGAEVIIAWNNGEEHIFTGLKPELGHGYADFVMASDVSYSVRMADGGTSASDLSVPICTSTDGSEYYGGLLLTFQQP